MTLDEAIKHCEDVAEDRCGCAEDCVEEHRQLAEWLKELRERRAKDEPTSSKMEQVEDEEQSCDTCKRKDYCSGAVYEYKNTEWWCLGYARDEPKSCVDCNFLTYRFNKIWCDIKCEGWHGDVCDRFKPKTEQTGREVE